MKKRHEKEAGMKKRYLILCAGLVLAVAACGKSDDPMSAEVPTNISALMILEQRFPSLSAEDRMTLRNYMMRRFAQEKFGLYEGVPGFDATPKAKTVGEAITAQRAWEAEFGGFMEQMPGILERMVPGFEFNYHEGPLGEEQLPGFGSPDDVPRWAPDDPNRSHSI